MQIKSNLSEIEKEIIGNATDNAVTTYIKTCEVSELATMCLRIQIKNGIFNRKFSDSREYLVDIWHNGSTEQRKKIFETFCGTYSTFWLNNEV